MALIKKEIQIPPEEKNLRLDIFLARKYKNFSRYTWQERIKKGLVLVNHQTTKKSYLLKEKDIITFFYPEKAEPEVNKNFKILYEDDFLLGIDKPANLPVHPSGNYKKNTLNHLLKIYYSTLSKQKDDFYCHPIHRIDKETSGIVLYGKTPEIIKKMNEIFQKSEIIKKYYVVVFGKIEKEFTLEGYIGKDFLSKIKRKQKFISFEQVENFTNQLCAKFVNQNQFEIYYNQTVYNYKYCRTIFFPIKIKKIVHPIYNFITLLEAKLFTGRLHQIRASLYNSGYPIVGDKIYGTNEEYFLSFLANQEYTKEIIKNLLLTRTALHSYQMEFFHPFLLKKIILESPLPDDMKNLIEI